MAIRLILADDHSVLRAGLKVFFEEQAESKFEVIGEASNGEQAVALVEKLKPDLLLLDLSMPVMGGMETTIELRKRGSKVKILILTQFSESIYLKRLLECGANGYILKSARGEELVSAVRALIAGGTYIDPSLAGNIFSAAQDVKPPESDEGSEEAYAKLTPRERQILKLIAEGASNKEIAATLNVAVKTVMSHRVNLMEKLGIKNRSKLIQFAIRVGLIPMP
jgi:DNA-binding NarL/FixJ family response regulator